VNGITFGDNGELYIQVGSNTNGGLPGQLTGSQLQKENVLSAATLVAYLSKPDFDGFIKYSDDDDGNQIAGLDVEVFAAGNRNPFGIVFHSNGNVSLALTVPCRPSLQYDDKNTVVSCTIF